MAVGAVAEKDSVAVREIVVLLYRSPYPIMDHGSGFHAYPCTLSYFSSMPAVGAASGLHHAWADIKFEDGTMVHQTSKPSKVDRGATFFLCQYSFGRFVVDYAEGCSDNKI